MGDTPDKLHCSYCGQLRLNLTKRIIFKAEDGKILWSKEAYICANCKRKEKNAKSNKT